MASKVLTASGRDMPEALVAGQRDPEVLAELARGRMRPKLPRLREAPQGRFGAHHALLVSQMLVRIDHADETITQLSAEIDRVIGPFEQLVRLLMTIPGVGRRIAEIIIAEIGADMGRFPSEQHLASWAGMCPGTGESAGKHKSGRTRQGSKWLRKALVEAAHAASRTDTYLAAQFARLRGRRGPKKAAVAVGHSILVIAWHLLSRGQPYSDLGADYFIARQSKEAYRNKLVRQLERMGYQVALEPASAA